MAETNYQRYFGTPEKAAETIMRITTLCYTRKCTACPLYYTDCIELECIAEWLESEAE